MIAQLKCAPAVSPRTLVIVAATGTGLLVVVVSPSSPLVFEPQHQVAPFESAAHACSEPTVLVTTLVGNSTRRGTAASTFVPSPIWPDAFLPQHHTVPGSVRAQVLWAPA